MQQSLEEHEYAIQLGNKIRTARKGYQMTLAELAEEVGVTRSFLSQVERGVVNPSVTTLRKIAQALRVPLFILLSDDEFPPNALVRKDERRTIVLSFSNLTYQLLSPDLNRKIEMVYSKIEPGAVSCDEPISHPGEECILVLKGTVRIEVGDEVFVVGEGDSLYFDCGLPHRLTNVDSVTAEMVSAITPPSF